MISDASSCRGARTRVARNYACYARAIDERAGVSGVLGPADVRLPGKRGGNIPAHVAMQWRRPALPRARASLMAASARARARARCHSFT